MYLQNMSIKCRDSTKKLVFSLFLCAACLPPSLMMHVPISELQCNGTDVYIYDTIFQLLQH